MSAHVEIRSTSYRQDGQLAVHSSVEHFVGSGMTLSELFARLRTDMLPIIVAAAAASPAGDGTEATGRVGIDMDDDPWLTFSILNPRRFLENLEEQFERMQKVATRLVADHRPVGIGGRHA